MAVQTAEVGEVVGSEMTAATGLGGEGNPTAIHLAHHHPHRRKALIVVVQLCTG
jgi:hypothetical protein